MSERFNALDQLVNLNYGVDNYGQDVTLPLGTDTLALQSITWSAINELLQVKATGADVDIEEYSRALSDIDTLGIMNEGDGIRYSRTFDFLSDMSAWIYKINLTFAVALSITAISSGNHSIDSVQVLVQELKGDGTLVREILTASQNTGMTNLTAINNSVAIMHFENNKPFKISTGNIVRLTISFSSTDTGVATTFEGIMPLFYFQEGSLLKTMCESALILHVHPALDHAFPVTRDSSVTTRLNYAGVDKNNNSRGAVRFT